MALVRSNLPDVARRIGEDWGIIEPYESDEDVMLHFAEILKARNKETRGALYAEIAAALLTVTFEAATGRKLPGWVSYILTQVAFAKRFR